MFGTIRKHQTWLWAIIITLTVISFVIFFSPYTRMNDQTRGTVNYGSINGERVTAEDFANAYKEVELQYFFRTGNWPSEQMREEVDAEAYNWILLIQKENQMGIRVGADVAAQAARGMIGQFAQSQRAEITPQVFITRILQPRGFQAEDLDRFARHYLGIQELIATIGQSGKLVAPQEAKALYVREHEELATEAVFFTATNYVASVVITNEAITQYYSNHISEYKIPERVQVSYVEFNLTNFQADAAKELAKMTNMDADIEAAYRQNGTNLLREVKATSLEDAKTKIREARTKVFEAQFARRKAAEFASPISDMNTVKPETLGMLAQSNGLPVKVTAPFDRDEGPKDIDVGEDFTKAAFALTPTEPIGPLLVGKDAAYVIAYDKRLPSETPPLEQVRDKVTADYKHSQAVAKAREAGTQLSQKVIVGMIGGKTFAAICEEAKIKPVILPPFSLSTRSLPEVEEYVRLDGLKQLAFSTPPGKASSFQATPDGGVILYVKSKLPPDPVKMASDLPGFAQYLRESRTHESFQIWFAKERERGLRNVPLPQRKQGPGAPSRTRKT